MKPQHGSVVGGKYRLERALASGGMGSVWIARDTRLENQVAVKFMSEAIAGSPTAANRFEREAKAAAQLKSPHVVHIYDYGVEEGTAYIAMELLEGEDLESVLDRERRLAIPRAAEILGQAAKALRAAHEARIVHRDIKPANLFLARSGEDIVVKVLDFGIAKETALAPERRGPTATGAILGSPLYMSPEQARGGTITDRSDLWSLGVVAFEMITGSQPFLGASVGDVIAKICGDQLPVPTRFAPDLQPEVDAFFARALARDPAERFPSARAFADAFAELAALPPSPRAADRSPGRLGETGEVAAPAPIRLDDTLPALVTRGNDAIPAATAAHDRSIQTATTTGRELAPPGPRSRAKAAVPAAVLAFGLALAGFYVLRPAAPDPRPIDGAPSTPPASSPPEIARSVEPAAPTSASVGSPPVVSPAPPALPASASVTAPPRPAPPTTPSRPAPTARPTTSPRPSVDPIFGLPAPK